MRFRPIATLPALALLLGGCTAAPPEERSADPSRTAATVAPDLRTARLVDLSHAFGPETLYWPTSPSRFDLTRLSHGQTAGGFFYAANAFCAPEHGGTHLDAPVHFAANGETVERIPLRRLIAPAVVIDVSVPASRDPDYRLKVEDVHAWEGRNGTIPAGAAVLLRTGWASRWPDRRRYFGDDTPGDASRLHFPSFGPEAADLLVSQRRVAALGVDTASIDAGPSTDFRVHRLTAAAGVPGLENLTGLDALPDRGAWIFALPMKIAGGSGAPVRAVALLPD